MDYRQWHWRVKDRQLFITVLTETGNPGTAAAAIGQTLAAAYRMRDRWPALAEEWQRALAIAWEQVEMRMLSTLLDGEATEINARVALEMLKRRKAPVGALPNSGRRRPSMLAGLWVWTTRETMPRRQPTCCDN